MTCKLAMSRGGRVDRGLDVITPFIIKLKDEFVMEVMADEPMFDGYTDDEIKRAFIEYIAGE